MQLTSTELTILFWLGIVFVIIGGCLMAWSVVDGRKKAVAGPPDGWTKFLEALAALVDKLAAYFPNYAGRVGFAMVVIGLFLIFYPAHANAMP